jgi:methionyl-tRNA synthetase
MARTYITVSIPYVNAAPHLGYALELVQADTLARHRRAAGDEVRLLGGTDENSLKNVLAAEAEGVPTAALVERNARAFAALSEPLHVELDDFIRTSRDPRHAPGVERLWRASAERGDFYRKWYEGPYCVGCEQFYAPDDLVEGRCPEHGVGAEWVAEENWFFRLSRYEDELRARLESGALAIRPEAYRNEATALVRGGLEDISVSRSRRRARGWGIPVPDDDTQVVYVWWDALANYVTALGYGTDSDDYRRWWVEADRRIHVIGKDILRFHAVYWPALLLSVGAPLPTAIHVHPFLTVDGRKLSKSAGAAIDPVALTRRYSVDALRWWLLRDVPRTADADFTERRLAARYTEDLANGVGNLASRVATLVRTLRGGVVPDVPGGELDATLRRLADELPASVADHIARFDFRGALGAVLDVVAAANRHVEAVRPWELARHEGTDAETARAVDACLASAALVVAAVAETLDPFLPGAGAALERPGPAFPRIATEAED